MAGLRPCASPHAAQQYQAHLWNGGMNSEENPYAFQPVSGDASAAGSSVGHFSPTAYVHHGGLATLVRILLVLYLIGLAVGVMSILMQLGLLQEAQSGNMGPDFESRVKFNDLWRVAVGLFRLALFVVTAIASLVLLHRLRVNVDQLGATGLTSSPGWSVGWFFVPVANLWKPFQATRQTWQASENPESWSSVTAPSFIGVWWTTWILAGIIGQAAWRFPTGTVDQLITGTWIELAAAGVEVVSTVCYMMLFRRLPAVQLKTFRRLSSPSGNESLEDFGPTF